MRRIVSAYEVAHFWANKAQPYASTPTRNLTCDGGALVSYSTQIARHVEKDSEADGDRLTRDLRGKAWVLFDRCTFSVTTAKQMSDARRASRHLSHIVVEYGTRNQRLPFSPSVILRDAQHELNDLWACFPHSGSKVAQWKALEDLRSRLEHFTEFACAWGEALPVNPCTLSAIVCARICEQGEAMAERLSVAACAAAVTRRANRDAAWEARNAEWKAQEALRDAERALNLPRWLAGEAVPIHSLPKHGGIFLRVCPSDPQRVETSWGAVVSLSSAVRLYRLCEMRKGLGYSASERPSAFQVGPYTLTAIDTEGNATVGCHSLPFVEMKRLADSLGEAVLSKAVPMVALAAEEVAS